MCKHHSSSHGHGFHHGDHHRDGHVHHHTGNAAYEHEHAHTAIHAGGSALSPRDKLVVRLEHFVRHNGEHADLLEKLVHAARELGMGAAADEIRSAADCAYRESEHLLKALGVLKSE